MNGHKLLRQRLLPLHCGAALVALLSACATTLPKQAKAPGETRVIDFALWSGVPGARFGDRIDKVQGSRRIRGPIAWTHPISGEKLRVYVRSNKEDDGTKLQYFTLRPDGTALARVYDKRPGQAERFFVNDAFFPLGPWRDEQAREYDATEYQNGRVMKRYLTLRVKRLSFTYQDNKDSLRYAWMARNIGDQPLFHESYTFSPGVGFADFDNKLKKLARRVGRPGRAQ